MGLISRFRPSYTRGIHPKGLSMKIRSASALLASTLAAFPGAGRAITIDGTEPTVEIVADVPAGFRSQIEARMNASLEAAFTSTLDEARANLAQYNEQKELAQGFANANAYSTHSATLQGYQNYKLFAVSTGMMIGFQAPSADVGYYSRIGDDIQEKGDVYAGVGLGFSYANVGINAGFLAPGLYLNAKFGAFEQEVDDFSIEFSSMGVGANMRLLDSRSLVGLVTWRGISVGSGFYRQSNKVSMIIEPDSIVTQVPFREAVVNSAPASDRAAYGAAMDQLGYTAAEPDADMVLQPTFEMGIDIATYTIPLEATTAVSLLWGAVNLSAGAGVDLNFGSSEIVLKGLAAANTSSDTTKVKFTEAEVTIDGSSDNGPSFVRPRLMGGLGIGLGPVKVDVPVLYYIASGFAAGITLAVVW
jgi:hypothetical protein